MLWGKDDQITVTYCRDCQDIGFVYVQTHERTAWMFCYCQKGKETEKSREPYSQYTCTPRWKKGEFDLVFGFSILKFPMEKFKPEKPDPQKSFMETLAQKQINFTKELEDSCNYWAGKK